MSLRDLAAFMARSRADEIAAARLKNLWDDANQAAKVTFAMQLFEAGELGVRELRAMLLAAGLTPEKGAANAAKILEAYVPASKQSQMIDSLKTAGHSDLVTAMAKALASS